MHTVEAHDRRIQVIEGEGDVPGFLLFLPRYAPGRPIDTPDERTAALTGWVYASIRVDELTSGLVDAGGPGIAFAIHEEGQDRALFDTGLAQALLFTHAHDHLLRAALAEITDPDPPAPSRLRAADRAYQRAFDDLAHYAHLAA